MIKFKISSSTAKGYAILDGDQVVGVFGLKVEKDRNVLFFDSIPWNRDAACMKIKKGLVKGARIVRALIAGVSGPVYSKAKGDIKQAGDYLEFIGFKPLQQDTWVWPR